MNGYWDGEKTVPNAIQSVDQKINQCENFLTSAKEKQDMLKRINDVPKCGQQEVSSKLGISQTALFDLVKQRNTILDEIIIKKWSYPAKENR